MTVSKIVSNPTFQQMMNYEPCTENEQQQKMMKRQLIKSVIDAYGDTYYRLKEGTRQAIDMMCWLSAERGFVFAGDDYLGDRYDISDRTVRNVAKILRKAGVILTVYRSSTKHNGRGCPIHLFVVHPYFNHWTSLLNLDFQANFQAEKAETPCESKDEQPKNVSTNDLSLKSINKNIRKVLRLDSTFTASFVPKEFVQAVRPFFDDAVTIEDFWKSVYLDTKMICDIVSSETITYTAIDAFKQAVRGYKRGKVKTTLIRYFTGTFKKRMDQVYFDLPLPS
ncbi:transcriptional regulator [Mesobacillus foraminis]|uniref:helix-turn-helix domain-containing protein n=1 Tax=Mesobacillus foraminis TaxID=279826 RepID=UPI001BE64614|nr:helix-turn-helix domain-containing protein [Mesobacillus foraminis]MBT2757897.1 transcriptional regulator [Mesobacillus foraminis]